MEHSHDSRSIHIPLLITLCIMLLRYLTGDLSAQIAGNSNTAFYCCLILQELLLWGLPGLLLLQKVRYRTVPGQVVLYPFSLLSGASVMCLMSVFTTALWRNSFPSGDLPLSAPTDIGGWILAFIALVLVPAISQELFYRGGLFLSAARINSRFAFILTFLSFVLMHGSLSALPAHLAISLLLTFAMVKTGSLTLCILIHIGYNAASLLIPAMASNMTAAILLPVLIIVGFVVILVRQPRQRTTNHETIDPVSAVLTTILFALCTIGYLL